MRRKNEASSKWGVQVGLGVDVAIDWTIMKSAFSTYAQGVSKTLMSGQPASRK